MKSAAGNHKGCFLTFPVITGRTANDFLVLCFIEHDKAARYRRVEVFLAQAFQQDCFAAGIDDDIARVVRADREAEGDFLGGAKSGDAGQHDRQPCAQGE